MVLYPCPNVANPRLSDDGQQLWPAQDLFRSAWGFDSGVAPGFKPYIFANMYGRARRVAQAPVLVALQWDRSLTAWLWLSVLPLMPVLYFLPPLPLLPNARAISAAGNRGAKQVQLREVVLRDNRLPFCNLAQ